MVNYTENGIIEININEYFKQYKNIISTCLNDGYILPASLEIIDVPEKYDYTYEEKLKFKITEEASSKRQQMFMDREVRLNMIDVDVTDYKLYFEELKNLENEELLNFISKYPMYEKILK